MRDIDFLWQICIEGPKILLDGNFYDLNQRLCYNDSEKRSWSEKTFTGLWNQLHDGHKWELKMTKWELFCL